MLMETGMQGGFSGRTNVERCQTEGGLHVSLLPLKVGTEQDKQLALGWAERVSIPRNKGPEAGG